MKYFVPVALFNAIKKLVQVFLHLQIIERSMACVEQFLQVLVEIFENEGELSVRMKYIDEPHDIRMLELL